MLLYAKLESEVLVHLVTFCKMAFFQLNFYANASYSCRQLL